MLHREEGLLGRGHDLEAPCQRPARRHPRPSSRQRDPGHGGGMQGRPDCLHGRSCAHAGFAGAHHRGDLRAKLRHRPHAPRLPGGPEGSAVLGPRPWRVRPEGAGGRVQARRGPGRHELLRGRPGHLEYARPARLPRGACPEACGGAVHGPHEPEEVCRADAGGAQLLPAATGGRRPRRHFPGAAPRRLRRVLVLLAARRPEPPHEPGLAARLRLGVLLPLRLLEAQVGT
mmetsp:Transcript_140042/g.435553  ORF Transcript_140042/g.435553 Transcript_140042/m.435553 type:complete len:230 (+) Transcript_140042:849-1538(+)